MYYRDKSITVAIVKEIEIYKIRKWRKRFRIIFR